MDVTTALTLAGGSRAAVTGFLMLISGQEPVLCEELLESFPPQCGGPRIQVVGLEAAAMPSLHEAEGVRWTANSVTLSGILREGRLHLTD